MAIFVIYDYPINIICQFIIRYIEIGLICGTCNALPLIGSSLIKIYITNVTTHMFEYFISIRVDLHFLCSLWQQNSDDIRGQSSSHTKNETQIIDTQHNNTHNYLQKP